ncbi:MAG: 50S ribosomal protein L4 [Candidatus Micrarchaeota archaeon]
MKANVLSLSGSVVREVELPSQFGESVRRDLIARAVISEQTRAYQPKGALKEAGNQTSAEYRGRKESYGAIKNRGISRLPREKFPKGRFGRVRIVPFSVKGRRAHPPVPQEILIEKINAKEYRKALASAIAATAHKEVVKARGHRFNGNLTFPVVVENRIEEMKKTKEVVGALTALKISGDLERGRARKKRSGVHAGRKGGYKTPKSVLIVVGEDKGILRAARNIPGVDATTADKLTAQLLAPGTRAGRLTLWSESALATLAKI